ncbi:MAG TPA: hypothetical protein VLX68_10055 [Chitinivibrionales bacterium]|nr:hypothetical protein [Chitinivibrionales bacterium]
MKDAAPVNGLFGKLLRQYPEIVLLARTGAKGVVVNYVDREGDDKGFGVDVSDSAWFSSPKSGMAAWHGPLTKETRRSVVLWSRPFSGRAAVGGDRFGGVVAMKVDVTTCFKEFAALEKGPFEILFNGQTFYYLSWNDSIPFADRTVSMPGNIKFTVRRPKNADEKSRSAPAAVALSKQEEAKSAVAASAGKTSNVGEHKAAHKEEAVPPEDTAASGETGSPNKKLSHSDLWIKLLALAVLLAGALFGVLTVGRLRRRKASDDIMLEDTHQPEKHEEPPAVSAQEAESENLVHISEDMHEKPDEDRKPASENKKELIEEIGEAGAHVITVRAEAVTDVNTEAKAVLTAKDKARIKEEEKKKAEERFAAKISEEALKELTATITKKVRDEQAGRLRVTAEEELKNEFKRTVLDSEKESISRKARQEVERELHASVERESREALLAQARNELAAEVRKQLEEKEKGKIYEKELESLTAAVRQQLVEKEMPGLVEERRRLMANEIKEEVAASHTDEFREQARAALKNEIAEAVKKEDGDRVREEETLALRQSLRRKLAEEETSRLTAKALESLEAEIRGKVEKNEGAVLRERILAEVKDEIRAGLIDKEQEAIREEQRGKLEKELYAEIAAAETEKIRAALVDRVTREERARVESEERKNIIEAEKNRIISHESPALREQLRAQIREEEMKTIKETVKAEIYSETAQVIRNNIEQKYKNAVQDKIAELKESLAVRARADVRTDLQKEYQSLLDKVEQLSGTLAGSDALQSFGKTIALLAEEKKKFKNLNLNTAQTESLLDYLKRMHSRLTIHLDKIDQSVRELILSAGSVKAKINKEE